MTDISGKILCVDDEPMVLDGLRRQLRGRFELSTAVGGEAGLETIRQQGPFAVIMSDYRMPGMDGVAFLRQAHATSPETVLVMLTGQTELSVAIAALHEGHIFRFLNKPCERTTLEATLRDALGQYRLVVSERLLRQELDRANAELTRVNANLERLVARRTATIEALYRLTTELNGLESLEEVGSVIAQRAAELSGCTRAALLLPDAGGDHLLVRAEAGLEAGAPVHLRVPVGAPLAGVVFRDGQSVVINRIEELAEYGDCREPAGLLALPLAQIALLTGDGPVGVLLAGPRAGGHAFDNDALAALRAVSETAAIAVLNQLRRQERDDARDATILALAKLAEHRDPETGAHLERVQCYCRLLAETLATAPAYADVVTRGYIHSMVQSSPLHDIGKVGIPDDILLKPGRLTPDEFEIMKRHTIIGGDTIRALIEQGRRQQFLQMGMDIAYSHHEKFNGTGYPRGLAGEAIPLPARILAVADVYDALTSKRVYKPAMPHAEAAAIIKADSGKHFDPDLVAAFVQQEAEFERLSIALAEPVPTFPVEAGSHQPVGR